jgi:hypothetical protein
MILEKLLHGLVFSDVMRLMIAEPLGYLWREYGIEKRIQGRFGTHFGTPRRAYSLFKFTLKHTMTAIDKTQLLIDTHESALGLGFRFERNCIRIEEGVRVIRKGIPSLLKLTDDI